LKKLITILLFFSYTAAHATITISISSPTINQVTDSVVQIQASVQSTYSLTSLVAIVNGRVDTLQYESEINEFNGYLSLSGLPQGDTLQLVVIATDFFNNKQSDTVGIIYAQRPTLKVIFPYNQANANPSLPIKAVSLGASPCTINVYFESGAQSFNGIFINSVDTAISFPAGTTDFSATIYFTVTDKWGQTNYDSRTFFFENNLYLKQLFAGTGQIFDFNYNKVLVVNNGYDGGKIVDINTLDSDVIKSSNTFVYFDNGQQSFLTPYGTVWGQQLNQRSFDWNNDSLYTLSGQYPYVSTAGKYATWSAVDPESGGEAAVYLRDLSTRTDTKLADADGGQDNAVGPNGVVFTVSNGILVRIQNNNTTPLTNLNAGTILNPITDGNYVAYSTEDGAGNYYIYMHDGSNETQLSYFENPSYPYPAAGVNYQIANKYIAYSKPDVSGVYQIWLRDSTGTNKQVTYFGTGSTIERLDPYGDIMYLNGGTLYLAINGGSLLPTALGSLALYNASVYYRDSSWYVVEGNYLYKILVNAYVTVADGNWNDPSVWQDNMVPQANADVIVKNNITVNTNVTCNSLKVIQPASVTVLTGFNITVTH